MTNALDGPRREIRRIFHDGVQRVSVSDDGWELVLGDGRRVVEAAARWAQRDAERAVAASPAGAH